MTKGQKSLKITLFLAMLTALSIILGKYLAIRGGDIMRFSLENMPIIFAGIAFGPVAGASVGLVADLVGCVMVGYTINPIVTIGAVSIGALSGIFFRLTGRIDIDNRFRLPITVAISHIVGSIIVKTVGLYAYYNMPFYLLLLWRVLNYVIVGALDAIAIHTLLKSKGVQIELNKLTDDVK